MNILPKKRWHVRTKENIARVRKDEAEAAEKERLETLRTENADREARLCVLRDKAKQKLLESGVPIEEPSEPEQPSTSAHNGHIDLFSDFENAVQTTNKDHDTETKQKKEEYEKKIGYLTYLGQDTNEAQKKKNWYEIAPEVSRFSRTSDIKDTYEKLVLKDAEGKPKVCELDVKDGEVSYKSKQRLDPINAFKKYCHPKETKQEKKSEISDFKSVVTIQNCGHDKYKSKKKKHKKDKHNEKDKKHDEKLQKLQKLRADRLKREKQEKSRTEMFLVGLNGTTSQSEKPVAAPKVKPKYNSQFNPELARQNFTSY